jgi:hypothetical protein
MVLLWILSSAVKHGAHDWSKRRPLLGPGRPARIHVFTFEAVSKLMNMMGSGLGPEGAIRNR